MRRVITVILLLIVGVTAGLATNSARAFRERVLLDDRAKTKVQSRTPTGDAEIVEWSFFVLERKAPKELSWPLGWLVRQPIEVLWGTVYGLAGLVGGCLFLLILLVEPSIVGRAPSEIGQEFSGARLLSRVVLSSAAGVLSFLALRLPVSLAIVRLESVSTTNSDVLSSLLLVPAAAGVFVTVFFRRLRAWFEEIFSKSSK